MQTTETAIILPLNVNASLSRRYILFVCLVGLCMLGVGTFSLTSNREQAPTIGEILFPILLIVFASLVLLLSLGALVLILQDERHFVRINQEGVFFSKLLPTVVNWSEISTLVPYKRMYLGHLQAALAIVPQDTEAITARIIVEHSKNFFSCYLSKINKWFYHRSEALSPFNISQVMLPISIDELITMIQERFANELNEHHVTILGWQSVNG